MGKRLKAGIKIGKKSGRSRGPLSWSQELGRMTTSKMIAAIKSNAS